MWNKSRETELTSRVTTLERELQDAKLGRENDRKQNDFALQRKDQENALAIEKLESRHLIALSEKEHEMATFKDTELAKAREKVIEAEKEVAVFKKENEMLTKITDLNGDVIDIKELVSNLIKKLPEINVSTLNFTGAPALTDGKSK